jgi:hypothetical protein
MAKMAEMKISYLECSNNTKYGLWTDEHKNNEKYSFQQYKMKLWVSPMKIFSTELWMVQQNITLYEIIGLPGFTEISRHFFFGLIVVSKFHFIFYESCEHFAISKASFTGMIYNQLPFAVATFSRKMRSLVDEYLVSARLENQQCFALCVWNNI